MTVFEVVIPIIFLTNLIFYLKLNFVAKKINIYDFPDKRRKIHKLKVPAIGGFIFIFNILVYLLIDLLFFDEIHNLGTEYFIISILLIFFLGIYDDKYNLDYKIKLVCFTIILVLYFLLDQKQIIQNLRFSSFDININLRNYSLLFTIISVTIFINAFNMHDGINGQSSLYTTTIFSYLIFKDQFVVLCSVIVLSSIFFLFNNLKEKIFLGDGGSLSLSFVFSILIINYYNQSLNSIVEEIFILMMMPGIDFIRLFVQRIYNQKNPFKADNTHFHHLLTKKFNSKLAIFFNFLMMIIPIFLMIFGINHFIIIVLFICLYLSVIAVVYK
jgi:UDP-GlcNAc:undecaprenyl-phosphate GlcNAc-1-phosphate transferase